MLIHRPDLPPELDRLVLKLMAKDPADRYQSAAEMLADLAKLRDVASDRVDRDDCRHEPGVRRRRLDESQADHSAAAVQHRRRPACADRDQPVRRLASSICPRALWLA